MLRMLMVALGMMISVLSLAEEPVAADPAMAALRARVADERRRIEQFRLLQFEVERLKLELEKKKAAAELGGLNVPASGQAVPAEAQDPAVLRYILIAGDNREALFDAAGVKQRVHEGDGLGGQAVKAISADGVVVKDAEGRETLLVIGK